MHLRKALKEDLPWINQKYDEVGFVHSIYEKEFIAIAEIDGNKVGLGRLVMISPSTFELGGIYVFKPYEGQGIAGKIVSFLLSHSQKNSTIYCLPFAKLSEFYLRHGFIPCTSSSGDIPKALLEKLEWCNNTYPDKVILLKQEKK